MEAGFQSMAGGDGVSDGVSVHSGFPNPALDRWGAGQSLTLDLNQLLIPSPTRTYLFRTAGHNWVDQGIYDGDIAVIDRGLDAREGDLVIAWQDSGFAICRRRVLATDDTIWGVVTAIIHQCSR